VCLQGRGGGGGVSRGCKKFISLRFYGAISAFIMKTRSPCQRTAIQNLISSSTAVLNSYLEQATPCPQKQNLANSSSCERDITAGNLQQHIQDTNLCSFSRSVVPASHSSSPPLRPHAEDMRFVRLVLKRNGFAYCALFVCTRRSRRVYLEGFVT
jgi:hypothetical protein